MCSFLVLTLHEGGLHVACAPHPRAGGGSSCGPCISLVRAQRAETGTFGSSGVWLLAARPNLAPGGAPSEQQETPDPSEALACMAALQLSDILRRCLLAQCMS